jgi:UrcA family protein
MTRQFASILAAIAIAAASIAPASAEQGRHNIHVTVSYSDLDLTRAEGAKTLSIRLNRAADKTCGNSHGSASLTIRRAIEACRAVAISSAVASIDAPLLTALYNPEKLKRLASR